MGRRDPFCVVPSWSFSELLDHVFAYYSGSGVQSTGYRLNAIRAWLSMAGRERAMAEIETFEALAGTRNPVELGESLWMTASSYTNLKRFVRKLPDDAISTPPLKAFISYKWESGEHVGWVRRFAADLRSRGIEAVLDQWEVRLGGSFTDYMQRSIAEAGVILFVITPGAVAEAEAPDGRGGALKFEVQMMNARRMSEGTKIVGIYRSGDRPPNYLRDHRYADFRRDELYDQSMSSLVDDLLGRSGPPPVRRTRSA